MLNRAMLVVTCFLMISCNTSSRRECRFRDTYECLRNQVWRCTDTGPSSEPFETNRNTLVFEQDCGELLCVEDAFPPCGSKPSPHSACEGRLDTTCSEGTIILCSEGGLGESFTRCKQQQCANVDDESFCVLEADPSPKCDSLEGVGCEDGEAFHCRAGYLVWQEACTTGFCINGRCASEYLPDDTCPPSGKSQICVEKRIVDCEDGHAARRYADCADSCVVPNGEAMCAIGTERDARCPSEGMAGVCDGLVAMQCQAGYLVGARTCINENACEVHECESESFHQRCALGADSVALCGEKQ